MTIPVIIILMAMQAQQSKPDVTVDSTATVECYSRYGGFCQLSPLTEAEKAEDEACRERDRIVQSLAKRTDLSAAEVLTLNNFLTPADAKKLFDEVNERTKLHIDSRCVLLFSFDNKLTGEHFSYCLNPVDQKTGMPVPFTNEDMQRMYCILQSHEGCDSLLYGKPSKAKPVTK